MLFNSLPILLILLFKIQTSTYGSRYALHQLHWYTSAHIFRAMHRASHFIVLQLKQFNFLISALTLHLIIPYRKIIIIQIFYYAIAHRVPRTRTLAQ